MFETFFGVILNNNLGPHEFSLTFVKNCDSYKEFCESKVAGMCLKGNIFFQQTKISSYQVKIFYWNLIRCFPIKLALHKCLLKNNKKNYKSY